MRMENISLVQTTFRLPLDVTAHQQLQLATWVHSCHMSYGSYDSRHKKAVVVSQVLLHGVLAFCQMDLCRLLWAVPAFCN